MSIAVATARSFTPFAQYTAQHTLASMQLPPCAQFLFQWMLQRRPAGREQEIDLKEFQAFTGQGRKQPYCFKQIRNALNSLIEAGLVEPVRQFNARFWKVITYHPGQKQTSQLEKKTSQNEKEISQKQPSNPHESVPIYREYKETIDTQPTQPPVLKRHEQGRSISGEPTSLSEDLTVDRSSPPGNTPGHIAESTKPIENLPKFSENNKLDPQLQGQIEEVIAPVPLNPQIKKLVLTANIEVIQDAISVVKQRKKVGKVKNPAGLFVKAVQEGWKPSVGDKVLELENRVPEGFNEWFELARKVGVVMASTMMNGVLCVCTTGGDWEPYEDLRFAFSLSWLRKVLKSGKSILPRMT
ncbi:MAG: hypothetical protein HC768_16575 [Acaryochloris sp. CRU_2_0]|nr:hypothetical protein [Acaryochloris sp. CRU_2_0]